MAIIIDAIDGTFARMIDIKRVLPRIDGAMLDNLVDFFNYALIPSYFVLVSPIFSSPWNVVCSILIVIGSAYQFTQSDAKTADHFFKGFPSYWNIVAFLFILLANSIHDQCAGGCFVFCSQFCPD